MAQALAVGPIASLGLGGFLIARYADGVAPFVVLAALVGGLSLAWTVSLYARRYAGAGAIYEYVTQSLGKTAGVGCAGAEFFLAPLGLGSLYLVFGLLFRTFATAHLSFDPTWWMPGLALAVVVAILQYRGIQPATRAQLLLTMLSAIPFVILAVVIVVERAANGHALAVFNPASEGAREPFRALLFAVLLFGGFEASAALGEETAMPHRSIPRAMLLTVALAGVFYLAVVYAATIAFGPDNVAAAWGDNPAALSLLADRFVGPPLGIVIEAAILVDLVAVALAYGNALARGWFALARDRLLPSVLAARSRYQTPAGGVAVGLAGGVLVLAAGTAVDDQFEVFEGLAVTLTLANLVVYIVLVAGSVRLMHERSRAPGRWLVIGLAVAVPVLGLYGTLVPPPTGPARWGAGLLLALAGVILAWVTFLRTRRKEILARAGNYTLRSNGVGIGR